MAYTITPDKPMPPKPKRQAIRKYPFADMNVGDSFFVPYPQADKAYSTARSHGHLYGKKFRVAKEAEQGCDGLRIWRTG